MNTEGIKTLYLKEVKRFLKVYNQSLVAPVITSLLFFAVFILSLGQHKGAVENTPFDIFLASGIIIMSCMQNSFANTSSSIILSKVMGTIIDILIPPLSPFEVAFATISAGVTRGVLVSFLVSVTFSFFVSFKIYSTGYLIFYVLSASVFMSAFGVLAALISETFDHLSSITNYVITPLTFLSGTFYSIGDLPEFWYNVSQYNPFFYIIDGFRYSITGNHNSSLFSGEMMITSINVILVVLVYIILKKGFFIKN